MFFNKLKNNFNNQQNCELLWGVLDKQNKLLLTANHIAAVQ